MSEFSARIAGDALSLPLIKPDWQGVPPHVKAFSTTRNGGFSHAPYGGEGSGGLNLGDHVGDQSHLVAANRELVRRQLPADVTWLTQVHGIMAINAANHDSHNSHDTQPTADASWVSKSGVVCAVLTADCLPVLFCNTKGSVVAAAHAGWRGLAQGVLQNTVASMREQSGEDIIAWMGPAIGPTCFEVGRDVVDAFSMSLPGTDTFFSRSSQRSDKYYADIYSLGRAALAQVGVTQVYGGQYCTVTESDRFYSYRRDGVTGRMASLIWID